jgi:hypothetical protein
MFYCFRENNKRGLAQIYIDLKNRFSNLTKIKISKNEGIIYANQCKSVASL